MLNKKELEILSFILKEGREIPVQKISEYFSISERNVRYEIEKIQEELRKERGYRKKIASCVILISFHIHSVVDFSFLHLDSRTQSFHVRDCYKRRSLLSRFHFHSS